MTISAEAPVAPPVVGKSRGGNPSLTLAVLATGSLSYSLLQSLIAPGLATIQHDVGATENGVAWLLTGFLLSAAVSTPILGRMGDVYGKRKILIVTFVALAVGLLIAALATSLTFLIIGRVIQGIGAGVFPLAFGIIRDEFPRERVAASIGLVSALLGLGGGFGVVLAGIVIESLNYHWLFWIPLVMVLGALAATVVVIPESPHRAPSSINWLGAALLSVGLVAILFAVSQTASWGWTSPKTLGLIAAGLGVLGLWVIAELRSRSPLVDMRMMAIRGVWTTNLVALVLGVGMFSSFILIPQLAQLPASGGVGFGMSVIGAGLLMLPTSVVMLVVGMCAGRVEARFGSKSALVAGSAFTMAGYVLLLVAHDSPEPVYVASGLLGVGIGLAFAAMANLIVQAVHRSQTGVATGMNTVARTVGAAFGGQLAATFLATNLGADGLPSITGFNYGFLLGAIACALGVLVGLAIPGNLRTRRAPVAEGGLA